MQSRFPWRFGRTSVGSLVGRSLTTTAVVDVDGTHGVAHMVVKQTLSLRELVSTSLRLTPQDASDLFELGSVWRLSGALCAAAVGPEKAAWVRSSGGLVTNRKKGSGRWERERSGDVESRQGDLIRVHTRPKRYPRHASVNWSDRVLHRDESLIVLSKPSGVLSVPSKDNARESCVEAVEEILSRKVFPCHQLDACTEGIFLLALSSSAADSTRHRMVNAAKFYHVLCEAPVALGRHVHHLRMDKTSKGEPTPRKNVVVEPGVGTKEAALDVMSCTHTQFGFELVVRLVTGRTHQIRSQLSALGAPVIDDTLYGNPCNASPDRIALQAHRLEMEGLDVSAGAPWWRTETKETLVR